MTVSMAGTEVLPDKPTFAFGKVTSIYLLGRVYFVLEVKPSKKLSDGSHYILECS